MRVIIIENTAYKVTEKQFGKLWAKHMKTFKHYHHENEIVMSEWLDKEKDNYKIIGLIEYDFRL